MDSILLLILIIIATVFVVCIVTGGVYMLLQRWKRSGSMRTMGTDVEMLVYGARV